MGNGTTKKKYDTLYPTNKYTVAQKADEFCAQFMSYEFISKVESKSQQAYIGWEKYNSCL